MRGCQTHGKGALQELPGASNCSESDLLKKDIWLITGRGGESDVDDFMEMLRAEGRHNWARWAQ